MDLKLPFSFSLYIFLSAGFVSLNQIKYWYEEISTLKKVHDFCHDILVQILNPLQQRSLIHKTETTITKKENKQL